MSKSTLIGSSGRLTNQTCHYGSMPGLAPTANVRPSITGTPGYKYLSVAANGVNWSTGDALNATARTNGCGLGRPCASGTSCLKHLKLWTGPNQLPPVLTGNKLLA